MRLRCLYCERRLAMYADGEISRRAAARIEDHLIDCGHCRATLLRLRAGQRFARQAPRRQAASDQWQAIEEIISAEERTVQQPVKAHSGRWLPAPVSVMGWLLGVVSLSLFMLTVIINRQSRPDPSGSTAALAT